MFEIKMQVRFIWKGKWKMVSENGIRIRKKKSLNQSRNKNKKAYAGAAPNPVAGLLNINVWFLLKFGESGQR